MLLFSPDIVLLPILIPVLHSFAFILLREKSFAVMIILTLLDLEEPFYKREKSK